MNSETQMSEGELERARTDQLHISCRVMLTQYMTLYLLSLGSKAPQTTYWKVVADPGILFGGLVVPSSFVRSSRSSPSLPPFPSLFSV
jgi:hypothetical protein